MNALGEEAETDPATIIQSFMTRQSLRQAWGEFQQTRPLIVAPVCTAMPFAVGAAAIEDRLGVLTPIDPR